MNNKRYHNLGLTLLLVNAFAYIPGSFYAPFLGAYYTKAGLNSIQIGILMTIAPLVAIFIQPLWAILSDKTGKRNEVLSLLVLGSGLAMFSYYIGKSFTSFFIAAFLLASFSTAIIPLCDAIIISIAGKNKFDFSKIRMGGTVGYAIMVTIAGYIVKWNPAIEFVLGFFGYMVLLFFVRRLPREKQVHKADLIKPAEQPIQKKPGLFKIFESRQIYFMLIFAFISQIGITFNGSFLGVYMTRLGYSESMIGIINCVAAASEIPVLLLINRLIRRVNPSRLIILACLLMGFRILLVTKGSLGYFILAQAMNGLTYMIIYFCCAMYISKNVKPANQSKGQSILTIVQAGIGSIVGNITGGFLADTFGLRMAYQYMAALLIGATALIGIIQISCSRNKREKMQ